MAEKEKPKSYLKQYATGRFIKDIDGDLDAGIKTAQEKGEDYSAKVHRKDLTSDEALKAGKDIIAKDKAFLDSDQESQEWDATAKVFKTVKRSGYYQRYNKPHPVKGY